jgi:hypothetical protein
VLAPFIVIVALLLLKVLLKYNTPPDVVIVPRLFTVFCINLSLLPLALMTPLVDIVRALPLNVPPLQLNWPLMVTGAVKLMVPLLKLMVSLVAGTPIGVQLLELNQSELTDPFQVLVDWAEANSGFARHARATTAAEKQPLRVIEIEAGGFKAYAFWVPNKRTNPTPIHDCTPGALANRSERIPNMKHPPWSQP